MEQRGMRIAGVAASVAVFLPHPKRHCQEGSRMTQSNTKHPGKPPNLPRKFRHAQE